MLTTFAAMGPGQARILTHARWRGVAITPLPCWETLRGGFVPCLQVEALVTMVDGLGTNGVLLAEDNPVLGWSGYSAGDSWGRRKSKVAF